MTRCGSFVSLCVLLAHVAGCGGSSSGTSHSPTQPSPFLTINVPSDIIKCGACEPFTATLTQGSTTQTVTPAWRTDNPAVATIAASGELTAISNGEVTVIAEYQGMSDSKRVRVVTDYGAVWYGQYLITRCEASNAFDEAGWCDPDGFAAGRTFPIGLELQQDRDIVTGTIWFGQISGPFSGRVATGGNLTGESKFTWSYDDGVVDILVSPLSVLREGDRIAQGTFTVVFAASGALGNCTIDARVMGLDKATSGRSQARRDVPSRAALRDVLRMLLER